MRLGDVCEVQNGFAFEGHRFSAMRGTPLIRIRDLKTNAPSLRYDGEIPPAYVVTRGDILVGMDGEFRAYRWSGSDALLNQRVCRLIPTERVLDRRYLYYAIGDALQEIEQATSLTTVKHLSSRQILEIRIPVPSLSLQVRIAARLDDYLDEVSIARQRANVRVEHCRLLALRLIAEAFRDMPESWPRRRLGDVSSFGRSPSTSSAGDALVTTVTSGSLTPFGFDFRGLSTGRMSSLDAADGAVDAGEVLVSRSNTELLVGRAARYPGGSAVVVASDLVFRLLPDPMWLSPEFLAKYLSVLQLNGYWLDRSSGASSTMKKITKSLLREVDVPVPPLTEQLRIVGDVGERMRAIGVLEVAIGAQQKAIGALPAALKRRALSGLAV